MPYVSLRCINKFPRSFPLPQPSCTKTSMSPLRTYRILSYERTSTSFTITFTYKGINRWQMTKGLLKKMEQDLQNTAEVRSSSCTKRRSTGMSSDSYCANWRTYKIDTLAQQDCEPLDRTDVRPYTFCSQHSLSYWPNSETVSWKRGGKDAPRRNYEVVQHSTTQRYSFYFYTDWP